MPARRRQPEHLPCLCIMSARRRRQHRHLPCLLFASALLLCAIFSLGQPAAAAVGEDGAVFGRVKELEGELDRSLPLSNQEGSGHSEDSAEKGQGEGGAATANQQQQKTEKQKEMEEEKNEGSETLPKKHMGRLIPMEEQLKVDLDLGTAKRMALNMLDHLSVSNNRLRISCTRAASSGVPASGTPESGVPASGAEAYSSLSPCPDFTACPAYLTSKAGKENEDVEIGTPLVPEGALSACSSGFSDAPMRAWPKPPSNCHSWYTMSAQNRTEFLFPFRLYSAQEGSPLPEDVPTFEALSKRPEVGCAHSEDFWPESPVAFAVYKMRNVFVTGEAVVCNDSFVFMRNGCQDGHHHSFPNKILRGTKAVKHVGEVVNWSYRQGSNFYHSLIESFPLFLSLAPILIQNNSIPILALDYQFRMYSSLLAPLVGVPMSAMNFYQMKPNDLFLADTLYQPVFPNCGHLSMRLWKSLRSRHLLHPNGIPLFNHTFSERPTQPLSDADMAKIPEDWVVVVAQRPGTRRKVLGIQEIEEAIMGFFPPGRVVVFKGDLGILEARAIFRRARLFVGGHGAALANLVFMPTGAHVLEIRPDQLHNPCYHSLADACSVDYNLVFGRGTGSGTVSVDVGEVMALVKDIAKSF